MARATSVGEGKHVGNSEGGFAPLPKPPPRNRLRRQSRRSKARSFWRKPNSSGRAFDFLHRLKAGPRTEGWPRRRASEVGLALLERDHHVGGVEGAEGLDDEIA